MTRIPDFENELRDWKEIQSLGESLRDNQKVLRSVVKQIECLYKLERIGEARAFLLNLPAVLDLSEFCTREMLADVYVAADDTEYFFDWYKNNVQHIGVSGGDQILVYALICHNKILEAKEVFEATFHVLRNAQQFGYALKHLPQLFDKKNDRHYFYQVALEKSLAELALGLNSSSKLDWYEVALRACYCLGDLEKFEYIALVMKKDSPKSAAPHLQFLETLQQRDNFSRSERKIFGIGLSKTGTLSLSKALVTLGLSTAHWTNPYSHDLLSEDDIPLFDSLTDISIGYLYKEIFSQYPNAKFILTVRDVVAWERSFLAHYARSVHATSFQDLEDIICNQHPARFGERYVTLHKELYFNYSSLEEAYSSYVQKTLDFFKGNEERLLVLDVSEKNAFKTLAEFLGIPCEQRDFPHENSKEVKNSWVSPISGERRTFHFRT